MTGTLAGGVNMPDGFYEPLDAKALDDLHELLDDWINGKPPPLWLYKVTGRDRKAFLKTSRALKPRVPELSGWKAISSQLRYVHPDELRALEHDVERTFGDIHKQPSVVAVTKLWLHEHAELPFTKSHSIYVFMTRRGSWLTWSDDSTGNRTGNVWDSSEKLLDYLERLRGKDARYAFSTDVPFETEWEGETTTLALYMRSELIYLFSKTWIERNYRQELLKLAIDNIADESI